MFKEIEEFNAIAGKTSDRISQLEAELREKKAESRKLDATYKQMVADDNAGISTYTVSAFNDVRKDIEELVGEIKVAEERLDGLQQSRKEQLKKPLDAVHSGHLRETREITSQLVELFKSAREHRARLMLIAAEAHSHFARAVELKRAHEDVKRSFGVDPSEMVMRTIPLGIPESVWFCQVSLVGTEKSEDKGFMSDYEELDKVYRTGELPAWVKHFDETGELLTNEDLAAVK